MTILTGLALAALCVVLVVGVMLVYSRFDGIDESTRRNMLDDSEWWNDV